VLGRLGEDEPSRAVLEPELEAVDHTKLHFVAVRDERGVTTRVDDGRVTGFGHGLVADHAGCWVETNPLARLPSTQVSYDRAGG